MTNRYIISLGSNLEEADARKRLRNAMNFLETLGTILASTEIYRSPDIRDASKPLYSNAIVAMECRIEPDRLNGLLKEIERLAGRVKGAAEVPVDLDIVCVNNSVVRPRDYSSAYFIKGLYLLNRGYNPD